MMRAPVLSWGKFAPLVLALWFTFTSGSCSARLGTGVIADSPGPDHPHAFKSSFYGSRAWRAMHAVHIGMECKGVTIHIESGTGMEWHRHVKTTGATINSVYKESPKECGALCEKTNGCVAWSWNRFDDSCYVQDQCERRVPNDDMVSGMKASFEGKWYLKTLQTSLTPGTDSNVDHPHTFRIDVDQKGDMLLQMVDGCEGIDADGKLEIASPVSWMSHEVQQRGDELEVRLKLGNYQTSLGKMKLRLTDGEMKVWFWSPGESIPHEFTAEKKQAVFAPFQRVTIKEDVEISASNVRVWSGNKTANLAFKLKKGDAGTVDHACHPRKTGVIPDHDQDKVVWVNDVHLAKTNLLEEVTEEEVKDVLENLGGVLDLAIRDHTTKKILRDPVKNTDGYTYERQATEQIGRPENETLSPDLTIMSLVSSVLQKVNVTRAAKPSPTDEVSAEEIKGVLTNVTDDLMRAISDPITGQILRDPVKAADGLTYERRSVQNLIWQGQAESKTLINQFGTPLSSFKLVPDYTVKELLSSVINKVKKAQRARERIQKHWRGFRVRSSTSQLEAKLAWVERQMKEQQRQMLALQERHAKITKALTGRTLVTKAKQTRVIENPKVGYEQRRGFGRRHKLWFTKFILT